MLASTQNEHQSPVEKSGWYPEPSEKIKACLKAARNPARIATMLGYVWRDPPQSRIGRQPDKHAISGPMPREGEKFQWVVRVRRGGSARGMALIKAADQKEADEIADKLTEDRIDWGDFACGFEIDSVEPYKARK